MENVHRQIKREEFDYQTVLDVLRGYARPRDKISDLLRKGVIVRVKKGLYVFGDDYRDRPFSRELLANLVFGPSYLSLDWALQYYGLIPEKVEAMTSVTTGRSRRFQTPVGLFVYRQIPDGAFRVGMTRIETGPEMAFLMATAEKALSDKVREDRGNGITTVSGMKAYLRDSLRVDMPALAELNPARIMLFADRYRSRKINLLASVIRNIRGKEGRVHE